MRITVAKRRELRSTSLRTSHRILDAHRPVSGAMAAIVAAVLVFSTVSAAPASADPIPAPSATAAPKGTVPGAAAKPAKTPTLKAVKTATIESWTPSTHSVTKDGKTTLDLFAQPEFKQDSKGWSAVDPTITAGKGTFPFEALGLANPVHFGRSADALVTIDTVNGPVVFGLDGANINAPTLSKGVVTYKGVFPGVDLEFRTEGGRVSKHLVLADSTTKSAFRFTITDPGHTLGDPVEGANESWTFPASVAFGTGIALPAPAAWAKVDGGGLPGSAHQKVSTTTHGYAIDLSVDPLWAQTASYPLVLDPAIVWTDEAWALTAAFAPTGATDCGTGPCPLAHPLTGDYWNEGSIWVGTGDFDNSGVKNYLGYVGTDLHALAGRQVSSAILEKFDYFSQSGSIAVAPLCTTIGANSTGADLDAARCGDFVDATYVQDPTQGYTWSSDQTEVVRAAASGTGPTPYAVGFAIGSQKNGQPGSFMKIWPPDLHLVYQGYPVPRPLTLEQTFGCACWAGTSSTNQATAADPVNTATGGLMEHVDDLSLAGVGQQIDLNRTYNSLDTASGPFGPGWSFAYGATLKKNTAGQYVFTDGSGTQTRFGAVVGGGYAPIDPAVSATLSDGPSGGFAVRSLAGGTMAFNASGALIAVKDERGQGVTIGYSGAVLTTVTDSLGQTLTFGWDTGTGTNARIISAATSDGRHVGYAYTTIAGAKRLTGLTDVAGKTTKYAYATAGGLSKITDPLGNISARNTYDSSGRISSQLDQTGANTTFTWNAATQTATVTDPTGKVRTDIYDGLNLVEQIDGNGNISQQLYDGDNNKAAAVDAAGKLYRSEYDDRDRLIRRTAPAPLNYSESWTYDDNDHVTSHTDQEGYTTTYHYNAAGLVASVDNPDGGTTTYTYTTGAGVEPANMLKTSTDPLGRATTYAYNAAGDLISTTSPSGKTTTNTYDAAHRLTSTTDPAGKVTSSTYDAAGRLLTTTDPTGAVTTNTFDADGRLTQTKNALGYITKYGYDSADRLITVTDPLSNITRTSYDAAGRVATSTDARGGVTSYAYDAAGRLTGTTDPLGHTASTAYNVLGQVTSVTDAAGGVTTYTYDALGQQTSVTDPDGVTATTTYDPRGNVASVSDGAGGFQQTSYDAMNRPTDASDSDGVYTSSTYDLAGQLTKQTKPRATSGYIAGYNDDDTTFTYDVDGNRTSVTDPRGNVPGANPTQFTSTVTYDADGRPLASTDALGRTSTTTYDAVGRPVTVADPKGNVTTTAYNKLGWVTSVKAPSQGTTSYTYDKMGNVLTRKDGLGNVTGYTYDALGHVLSQTDPLSRVTSMSYDAAGNLATVVKPSGTATTNPTDGTATYQYDAANRLIATAYSDTTPGFTYSYTTAGRLHAAARTQGGTTVASSTYTYDPAGRVTAAVATGPGGGTTNYGYSSAGRLTGAAWSTGMSASYSYNQVGELISVSPSGTGSVPPVSYAYDAAGNVTTVSRGTSPTTSTTAAYDAANQLVSLIQSAGSASPTKYGVTRDADGNPTQVTTTAGGATKTSLYGYDTANRLTSECYPTSGITCASNSPNTTYTYNVVGDRTKKTDRTVVGTVATTVSTTSTYDVADELLTQAVGTVTTATNTWSVNGTLASSTSSAGTRTFTSDLTDELTSAVLENGSTVSYTTDTHGNRTSRTVNGTVDATWAWDGIAQLPTRVGEFGSTGALTTSWLPDPTSATGAPLAQANGTSASWLLGDWAQNITAAVATTGSAVTGTKTLDAFGNARTGATGSLASAAFGFSGQYLDAVTGLYDMRARDYDATTGRFTAQDPASIATGMPVFASYLYGYANPLMFTDPTGMFSIGDAWDSAWERDRGAFNAAKDNVLNLAAFQPGAVAPWQVKRQLAVMYSFELGVKNDGWWTQINRTVNPVYQMLESGQATMDAWSNGDEYGEGYNGFNTELAAASTCLFAYGGAKVGAPKVTALVDGAASRLAGGGVNITGARFAQTWYRESFSAGQEALFKGKTINDVAAALRTGELAPQDVPINVIVRRGNTLILNTRSAQALQRAGIPRSDWSVIDRTGDSVYEKLLNQQLINNGLDNTGYPNPVSRG